MTKFRSSAKSKGRSAPLLYRFTRALKRAAAPLVSADIFLVYRTDLRNGIVRWKARAPVQISVATDDEVEEAARLIERETQGSVLELFRSRIRRDQKCFVAKIDGAVVAFNWIAFGLELETADLVVLRDDEAYGLNAYTAVAWRGHGIHTVLLYSMLQWVRDRGCRMVYTLVRAANFRSWKTHRRLRWGLSGVYCVLHAPWWAKRQCWTLYGSRYPIRAMYSLYTGHTEYGQ